MTQAPIKEQCSYVCGEYKGYCGKAEYIASDDLFHGEIIGVRDVVTFQARSVRDLRAAFRDSVDDYLDMCRERGVVPEKPFSGKFLARIPPEVHRALSMMAEMRKVSLNRFVSDCLTSVAEQSPMTTQSISSILEEPGGAVKFAAKIRKCRTAKIKSKTAAKSTGRKKQIR